MSSTTSFSGKTAVVTGVNREIGAAIALMFLAAGCRVYAAHHGEPERVATLQAAAAARPGHLTLWDCDLRTVTDNQSLVDRAVATYGGIDFYIANAGVTVFGLFLEMTPEQFDSVFDLNVRGSFFGAQAAARVMHAQQRPGRIVFSTSVTGVAALPGASVYGTSKAALVHLAAILGIELGRSGITVNAISIGATHNDRNLANEPDYDAIWAGLSPVGRVGQPEDVAHAVRFLCSDDAALINGQTISIDGGWSKLSPLQASLPKG